MTNRIGRLELLFWLVASNLAGTIVVVADSVLTHRSLESFHYPLDLPSALALVVVFAVIPRAQIARFHDLGWPTWTVAVMFIPLIDILAILLSLALPGQKLENRYGAPPRFLEGLRGRPSHNSGKPGDSDA
jgi:uncharacterized membrane protein YhaH (DUF805 family)